MYAIFKRELFGFLNAFMAYMAIGIFLLACSLLFWFFPETSFLEYGYAEMSGFFYLVPFLFIFLIPALTMRLYAEERREGTYVLLATRPVSETRIMLAKYLATLVLLFFALLPTVIYAYSLSELGFPKGNIDRGAVAGSYIGLFLLGCVMAAIGVFTSSLTKNQVISYVMAVFLAFLCYSGFDSVSKLFELSHTGDILSGLGLLSHYESMSRGVLDTRDLVYFASITCFFLGAARFVLGGRKW